MTQRARRIILMYISEVSGHHSATLAIESALRSLEPGVEILNLNAFNYTNPVSEKIVNKLYMGVIKRTPKVWDYLYDNQAVVRRLERIKKFVHSMNSPKLKKLFAQFNPDVVACSQAFPCGMVADYKRAYGSSLPLVAVLTDYVPHSYWLYDNVDYYVAPCEEVAGRLAEKGIPPGKIKAFGIPFDYRFNVPIDAVAVKGSLGFDEHVPVVLVMGGGQGLGPIETIVDSLDRAAARLQVIIVTGSNKLLYRKLKRREGRFAKKTVLYGYASNINELMTVSELIITKPGGITTAEALCKRLPMVIVQPIPGQEVNNTVYLTECGAAVRVDDPRQVGAVVADLVHRREKYRSMRAAAERIAKPTASVDTARFLLRLAHA